MKTHAERDLERLLAAPPAGEPPRGLAERIKDEIPEELPAPALRGGTVVRPVWHPHRWRLAAAFLMVIGGGALAWWTWREEPHPGAPVVDTAARGESAAQNESARRAEDAPAGADAPAPAEELEVTVRDDANQPLPGAVVEIEGPGGKRRTATDEEGRAVFLGLEPQEYEVTAGAEGFADDAPARVDLRREGDEARLERELRADVHEEITVTGERPTIDTSSATASSVAPRPPPPPDTRKRLEESRDEIRALGYIGPSARRVPVRQEVPKPATEIQPEPPLFVGSVQEGARAVGGRSQAGIEPGATARPSTGGTDEPNDAPYGDVFFRHYGVNPFLDPEEDRLSTFALDVDTGSWGVARRYLDGGHLPPPEAVRVEEIVNALDYGDPPPAEGDFALHAEGAPTPFGGGDRYRLLRFAIKAREVAAHDRKPAALTFVIDVSGSMAQDNRLGLVKASLGLLIDELRPDDRVALVVYGDRGRVVLAPTADKEALRAAIDGLHPDGSTNAEEGLVLGYDLASAALRPGAINRLILASDGVANVGRTGPDSILARVRAEAARGIELTTLGFGMGNYNDVLMERLADDGDGRYAYLDTLEEARRVLVEELTGTLQTVAEEARAQVEFNPEVVERYRLLGYENRDVADERFRDDTVDAGEIGAGHTVTALYEIKLHGQATGRAGERAYRGAPVATLRLRWRPEGTEEFVETERSLTLGELAERWERASPALRLAGLAAEYAELLRGSYWAREGSLDDVFRRLQRLQPELAGDPRAAELAALAGKAARRAPKPAASEQPE